MSDGCLLFSGGIEGLGAIYYRDRCSKEPRYERIVIDLLLEGKYPYEAVIDTASEWCILHPELAALIEESIVDSFAVGQSRKRGSQAGDTPRFNIRGVPYEGRMARVNLTLVASLGASCSLETTVFIPALPPGEKWPFPSFIGLKNFLDRMPWAVDPHQGLFCYVVPSH